MHVVADTREVTVPATMSAHSGDAVGEHSARITYNFAVLRVVPHAYTGAFVPIGVIVHAPTERYLGMRAVTNAHMLARMVPDADAELLAKYLRSYELMCDGDLIAGPLSLAAQSERFHWLTAPRSDVIQSGPVHEGWCAQTDTALDMLFASYIRLGT